LQCYPYVPVGGEMAVNCAILSYNGMAYFGFSGDVHAAPDLRRLENLLMTSFTELRDAVGIRPPQKKKVRRKRPGNSIAVRAIPVPGITPVATKTMAAPAPAATKIALLEPKRVLEPGPATMQENPLTQLIVA
jgi:WS/DGAT C-terminal domain